MSSCPVRRVPISWQRFTYDQGTMLVELVVKNLGVIEDARIPMGPGLTALTGETGAGKTMVVEALNLLLGGRPDSDRVRSGASEATVEGLFARGETEWVLRRILPASGRSRAYINGELATAAALAEIGAELLEIHGQHAQQALLQPRTQRAALDEFAGIDRTPLLHARRQVEQARTRLEELGGDERSRMREIDLLRFQLEEIDRVSPVVGEELLLDQEQDLLSGALAHQQAAFLAVAALSDEGAANDLLARAMNKLVDRSPFALVLARLRDAAAELEDCAGELRQLGESIEPDEERLDQVRSRRQMLVELRRKYGDSLSEVVAYADEARDRLEDLTAHDATLAGHEAELATAVAELQKVSEAIGKKRRAAASGLAAAVEDHLVGLALAGAKLEVRVTDTDELPGAGELVELRIAVNPGSAMGSLSKVASGGELSRVMLALRLVLSDAPPTMVFDEVDAGIGGEAALCVGRALAALGVHGQVIVVTHLPQVAAFADQQVLVAKTQQLGSARTTAVVLHEEDRLIELSRMLSGSPDSAIARDHAFELLSTAQGERRTEHS